MLLTSAVPRWACCKADAVRTEGYRRAMRARGLAAEIDVVSTTYPPRRVGTWVGSNCSPGQCRPTATFVGADIVAMGVLEAIAEAGLSVPGDIPVAGYDNTTFAALGPISLTSVDQAGREIGANAARLLLDRIADRSRPAAQVRLSPTLVVRRSTAPPR